MSEDASGPTSRQRLVAVVGILVAGILVGGLVGQVMGTSTNSVDRAAGVSVPEASAGYENAAQPATPTPSPTPTPTPTPNPNTEVYYATDSGFEVIDASGSDPPSSGNPFPDDNTLELPDMTLSASGNAEVTIDQRTGDYTNLSGISSSHDITVNPNDKQAVVLTSGLNSLDFGSTQYGVSPNVDLVYDAGSTASLTIQGTGLPEGTFVYAYDASRSVLDSATVDGNGDLTLSNLPSGTYNVDLARPSDDDDDDDNDDDDGGDGSGGDSGDSGGGTEDTGSGGGDSDTGSGDSDTGSGGGDSDTGSDDLYSDSGDSGDVIPGDDTDDGTTEFEISMPSDDGGDSGGDGESSNSIVLDLQDSGPDDGTDGQDGQDGTDESDSEDDSGQSDGGTDGDDDSAPRNVAVDSMVLRLAEDADPEFRISVREWSVDQDELLDSEAEGTQSSLTDAGASAGWPAPSSAAAVAMAGSNVDAQQTANQSDPRQFLRETGAAAVGYVEVNHTNPDTDITNVTFQFRVRKSYLNQTDVGPESVALYREETDSWNELDAGLVGENATFYFFEATSPGLSLFTIGSTRPVFETERAQLDAGSVAVGEAATVEATIGNLGSVDGTQTVALTANGEQVASESVEVAGQSTETVTLSFTPETAGEYDLAVTGQDAGVLSVEQVTTPTMTVTPQQTQTDTRTAASTGGQATVQQGGSDAESVETVARTVTGAGGGDGGFGGSLLIGVLAAVVLLVFAVLYWRRRNDEEGDTLA